ncbi:MAG: hypothetical protein MUF51_08900, partial [Vicinamibacteria bacterium]|nr:hypothetical protein [Vicinamibacteria bacterium]
MTRISDRLRRHAWLLAGFALVFTFTRWPDFLGWDDSFYVAQFTSAVADRDLLLHDDLLRLSKPLDGKLQMLVKISDSGALLNVFSIGPAVLNASYTWPLLVRAAPPVSFALRVALAVGSMAMLVLLALALIALLKRMGFTRGIARVAAVLSIALGPLALYGTRVTLASHLPSALCAALFLLCCVTWLQTSAPRHAAALGLTAGMLCITRWQEVVLVLAVIPAVAAFVLQNGPLRRRRLLGAAWALSAFALPIGVQLAAWRVQFGSALLIPQGGGFMRWHDPAIVPLLLSTYHGLLPWMPGFAIGLIALCVFPGA